MADDGVGVQAAPRIVVGLVCGHEALIVEGGITHVEPAVAGGPFVAVAVAVKFDAIAVRVGQVDSLADQVVGRALDWILGLDQVLEGSAEAPAGWHQDGEVVQAGMAWGRLGRWILAEAQKFGAACSKLGNAVFTRYLLEAEHVVIEIYGAVEVRDGQVYAPNGSFRGEGVRGFEGGHGVY